MEDSFKCFFCGHKLEWRGDNDAELELGIEYEGKNKVTSSWTCPECGAEYLITN